jgi:hypothetical protein
MLTDGQREATKHAIELLTAHLESLESGDQFGLETFQRLVTDAGLAPTDLIGGFLNLATIVLFHAAALSHKPAVEVLRSLAPRIDLA